MKTSDDLKLVPINIKTYKKHRIKSFRGMSIQKNGYLSVTPLMQKELELSIEDQIIFSKHKKRWFIRVGEKEGVGISKIKNRLSIRAGVGLVTAICADLRKTDKKITRLYISISRVPSGGLLWYELLTVGK